MDCYERPIEYDPGCPDFYFTCEAGQCVVNCPDTGCASDADCLAGQRCEVRCGNGWCEGVCVDDYECQSDADCPEGEQCMFDVYCDDEYCGGGHCEPIEQGCQSDADCQEGFHCEFTDWCDDGWCGQGICVADHTGCESDDECAEGERCEVYCGNGWCHGECLSASEECYSDADCAEGAFCQPLPNVDCWFFEDCPGTCVAGTWTFTQPVQCGGNAWEVDAAENPDLYAECFVNCEEGTNCGGAFQEICLVRTFFLSQGIALHDVRDVYDMGDVCMSCACPRGDTIYALADPVDVDRLLEFGFFLY